MMEHYILEGMIPVEADLMTWAKWFETANRHVANDMVGEVRVSTVFLGLDHRWGKGAPLLFETMVFGGEHDQDWCERYSTWEQAEIGHREMIERVKEATP